MLIVFESMKKCWHWSYILFFSITRISLPCYCPPASQFDTNNNSFYSLTLICDHPICFSEESIKEYYSVFFLCSIVHMRRCGLWCFTLMLWVLMLCYLCFLSEQLPADLSKMHLTDHAHQQAMHMAPSQSGCSIASDSGSSSLSDIYQVDVFTFLSEFTN